MVRPSSPSELQRKRNSRTGIRTKNSKVKRSGLLFTNRQIILIILMLILFMWSGIGYVWSNYEGTQIGFDLSRLHQEKLYLNELNKKLKVELAVLKSPQNLEAAARALGLREALPEQIVILP